MPGPGLVEPRLKARHLLAAPDERRAREEDACAVRLIRHLARFHQRCYALQLERTEVVEGERLPSGEQRLDNGAADLPRLRGSRATATMTA
jgi:hypothetical protein